MAFDERVQSDSLTESRTRRHRAIFVSDLHLGMRASQADSFLSFINSNEADTIYLIGDIIDFWKVSRGPVWPQSHDAIMKRLHVMMQNGARIVYVPGNHDAALREYCGTHIAGVEILRDCIHVTGDGKRLLVMHGDKFDVVVRYARWLAFLGDRSYDILLALNTPLHWIRRRLGLHYWSLSAFLKLKVNEAVSFIGQFEKSLAEEARRRNVDGVVCGHIHHAADRWMGGVRYLNCGDWVESCTAIVESHSGELSVVRWLDEARTASSVAPSWIPYTTQASQGTSKIVDGAPAPRPHASGHAHAALESREALRNGALRVTRSSA